VKTTRVGLPLLLMCVAAQLGARNSWQSKPYTQWTSEDVLTMLKDSPWAKDAVPKVRKAKGEDDIQSNCSGTTGPTALPSSPNNPEIGNVVKTLGKDSCTTDGDHRVTVRWDSALPVRQALSKQGWPLSERTPASYIVTVAGLPGAGEYMGPMVSAAVERLDQLVAATSITIKGKPALTPEKVEHGIDGASLLFTFPRTSAISLDDKEVEFVTKIGAMEVRRKFKLKDMVFQGKLEL
jgi:hypothetical protein